MWRISLWNDFSCRWTRFNCPSRHCFLFCFVLFFHFLPFLAVLFLLFSPCLYGFARCCDKRISSLTLKRTNLLRFERLQRRINTTFCSNSVQSNHSGNESLINGCVIGCLPFSMGKPVAPRGFAPKSHLPFVRVSSIYRKTTAKAWNWYQRWFEEMEHGATLFSRSANI